jgi:LysM repeat protein
MKTRSNNISPLSNVQAKPFISNMILMKDLNFEQRERVLLRLTPQSEFNAVLTGEVQLLDLHSGNLGVAPELKENADKFKDLKFFALINRQFTSGLNFNQLILYYLTGELQKNTPIQYIENGISVSNTLKNLPELEKALDVRWELVLFDTDLSLTESNTLQVQIRGGKIEHLIPLRSVLLETRWKETPLSDETVTHLLDSTERDLRVSQWAKKVDSPIYKRLTKRAQGKIMPLINPLIKEYTLSDLRFEREHEDVTIKSLKREFAADLSDLNSATSEIWKIIEDDLSKVKVNPKDTWESIAKRHRQNVEELKLLNPKGLVA